MSTIARTGRGAFLLIVSYLIALPPTVQVIKLFDLYFVESNLPGLVLQAAAVVPGFFLAAYAADQGLSLKKLGIYFVVAMVIGFPLSFVLPIQFDADIGIAVGYTVAYLVLYRPGLYLFQEEEEVQPTG